MAQSTEPEVLPPSRALAEPLEPQAQSIFEEPKAQEYLGRSPTELSRESASPELDPRRSPYRAYVFENGRETPNPTGTLLPGRID